MGIISSSKRFKLLYPLASWKIVGVCNDGVLLEWGSIGTAFSERGSIGTPSL